MARNKTSNASEEYGFEGPSGYLARVLVGSTEKVLELNELWRESVREFADKARRRGFSERAIEFYVEKIKNQAIPWQRRWNPDPGVRTRLIAKRMANGG